MNVLNFIEHISEVKKSLKFEHLLFQLTGVIFFIANNKSLLIMQIRVL